MRSVVDVQLCDVILCDFSYTLLALHVMLRTRMDHYIEIPISHVSIFKSSKVFGDNQQRPVACKDVLTLKLPKQLFCTALLPWFGF